MRFKIILSAALMLFLSATLISNTTLSATIDKNDPNFFDLFIPAEIPDPSGCSCHNTDSGGMIKRGSGSLSIGGNSTVVPGQVFNLTLAIFGFTEQASSGLMVGFREADSNNSEFITETIVLRNYFLDSNGDSPIFSMGEFKAPSVQGNYSITAMVVGATGVLEPVSYIWHLNTTKVITVSGALTSTTNITTSGGGGDSPVKIENMTNLLLIGGGSVVLNLVLVGALIFVQRTQRRNA